MTSTKTCQADSGQNVERAARPVKMDYSETYRENDKLEEHLGQHLGHLKHSFHRMLSWKDEALETARADADKILRLKEAVNHHRHEHEEEEEGEHLTILCQASGNPWRRRRSSGMFSTSSRRSLSAGTVGSLRKSSLMSGGSLLDSAVEEVDGVEEANEEDSYNGNSVTNYYSSPVTVRDIGKMSLTERRLAKEREQFSAKNLFNVKRKTSFHALDSANKRNNDLSPDTTPRTAAVSSSSGTIPGNSLHPSSSSNRQVRPKTSPAAYGKRSASRTRGYIRPATASFPRTNNSTNDGEDRRFSTRTPSRRARSRRELQQLVELKLDPFEGDDEDGDPPGGRSSQHHWGESNSGEHRLHHQDLLHSLQVGQVQLQARVSAFLRTLEEFNRRGGRHKSGLDQILEAS